MRIAPRWTPALLLAIPLLLPPSTANALPAPPERLTRAGFSPCEVEGVEGGGLCGSVSVWENRATKQGRKIDLRVLVLPSTSAQPAPDAVFYISGGPGYSAVADASDLGVFLGALRQERDMVFVDQRGIGGSNPLHCDNPGSESDPQGYLRDLFPVDVIRACRTQLESKADLTQYTTSIAMDDLDEVRERLGYPRINVIGGSYGTRAAQTYVKQHPSHVRSVVLSGVMTIEDRMPLYIARKAQEAIEKLFDDCGADAACRAAFPDPRGDLAKALARFAGGPVRQRITDPKSGRVFDLTLPRGAFTTTLRSLQYAPGRASRIPLILHQAAAGDFAAITKMAIDYFADPDWYLGTYLSITCAEDVARFTAADVPAQIAGTFVGDDRIRQQVDACKLWPTAKVPEEFFTPLRSNAPVLLITGWLDPATPPDLAVEVQKGLPNSRNVIIRDGAHGPGGLTNVQCYGQLMIDFIKNGTPYGLDTSCAETMKRPPFAERIEP